MISTQALSILSGATRLGAARHEANSADAARCALALMCSAASVLECDHSIDGEEPSDADAAKGATTLLAWDAARAAIEVVLSAHEATRARAVVACLPTDREERAVLRERLRRPLRFLVAHACRRAALEGVLPCGGLCGNQIVAARLHAIDATHWLISHRWWPIPAPRAAFDA